MVCAGCEAGSFPLGEEAHAFVDALARPLAEVPDAPERALQQADRASRRRWSTTRMSACVA